MPVILVVEDDQVMRKAIGTILNRGGFSVLNAANGREAMDMLETSSYDVVVTDLMMPYANGLEVVNRIRSDSAKNNVGVIIVSSSSNEDMVTEAFSLGADDYLKKPVMAGELLSRIRKLVGRNDKEPIQAPPGRIYPMASPETDSVPDDKDPITDKNGEPSYLIAVTRYVPEEQATPGAQTVFDGNSTPAAVPAPDGAGVWQAEDSVVDAADSRHAGPGRGRQAELAVNSPIVTSDRYMRRVAITLGIIAFIVIGMLLYIMRG